MTIWTLDALTPTLDSNVATLDGSAGSGTVSTPSEFIWVPSYGSSQDAELGLRVAKFGDGYSQRHSLGLNNIVDTWNLTFKDISLLTKTSITTFLRNHSSGKSFTWTPYQESIPVMVFCKKWSDVAANYNSHTISCVFERVYGE